MDTGISRSNVFYFVLVLLFFALSVFVLGSIGSIHATDTLFVFHLCVSLSSFFIPSSPHCRRRQLHGLTHTSRYCDCFLFSRSFFLGSLLFFLLRPYDEAARSLGRPREFNWYIRKRRIKREKNNTGSKREIRLWIFPSFFHRREEEGPFAVMALHENS